jgi:Uma2 family endonuclease
VAVRPERRFTWEDYVDFPEDQRYEVIDGEVYVVAAPTRRHQLVLGELYRVVANHVKAGGGGIVLIAPFDVVLDPGGDIVQPDLVFVADEDMDVLTDANAWGTPSWLVEVLSTWHPERDRKLKLARYEHFGVKEYWIVDPTAERVEIHRLEGGRYGEPSLHATRGLVSPLRPVGLEIELADLFSA